MNSKYVVALERLRTDATDYLVRHELEKFVDDPYCQAIDQEEWDSLDLDARAALSTLQIVIELEVREEFMSEREISALQDGFVFGVALRSLSQNVNREEDERRQLIQRQRELARRSRKRVSVPRVALASLPSEISTAGRFKEYVGAGICLTTVRIEVKPIKDPISGELIKFSFYDIKSGDRGLLSWSSLPKTLRQIGR